jgi:hypothetical protein
MASITLTGIPEEGKKRLEEVANREHRSLNQQAILLLERALAEEPVGFERAYRRFRKTHGSSPLKTGDLDDLRSEEKGRTIDL